MSAGPERPHRLRGAVVLITGASSGIGEACARRFAAAGARLVLAARRGDRLRSLAQELEAGGARPPVVVTLDVRDRSAVMSVVERWEGEGIVPDVLVNNAGLASGLGPLHEGDPQDWDRMIDTNLTGLLNVTRAVLPLMVARDQGHVVNIGSSAGRWAYPGGNVYVATKFAVRGLTSALNADLLGTSIRVSSVDPGLVETEFSTVRFHGDRDRAAAVYRGYTPLRAEDVADAVLYVTSAPAHVNVQELLLMPTDQRNSYLLHRRESPAR